MEFFKQSIASVWLLKPKRLGDARGYFSEIYSRRALAERGLNLEFVQDNVSLSQAAGTVRGLHFQGPPSEQTKLVSVLQGAIWDVVVDIRRGSPTFGHHVAAELTAENGLQMLAPRGFAHGFCTLVPSTLVLYKVDSFYDAARDFGIRWDDPALAIPWPWELHRTTLSEKDRKLPLLNEIPSIFEYPGDGP